MLRLRGGHRDPGAAAGHRKGRTVNRIQVAALGVIMICGVIASVACYVIGYVHGQQDRASRERATASR
jgi:hypothetical protein